MVITSIPLGKDKADFVASSSSSVYFPKAFLERGVRKLNTPLFEVSERKAFPHFLRCHCCLNDDAKLSYCCRTPDEERLFEQQDHWTSTIARERERFLAQSKTVQNDRISRRTEHGVHKLCHRCAN